MTLSRRLSTLALTITALSWSTPAPAQPSTESLHADVALGNGRFFVSGRPFLVRGIHYGPWRPGSGPNKAHAYPSLDAIAQDFEVMRGTGANTVLVYDAPGEVLDLAAQFGFKVVYVFAIDWHSIGGPGHQAIEDEIVARVSYLRAKPALLAWLLGNEVGGPILQTRGEAPILAGLRSVYAAVKDADPAHPISHANWPPARHLDLSFLDFISFNVYPLWPPEVVAMGFGPYVKNVLRPIAGDKPLLISEFGANTIEAGDQGQSRLIAESWRGLLEAGAAGGVVFEFADEWWKNYDNPLRSGDWWTRGPAADDELKQDEDPEETYGVVRADRSPKPALETVRAMFSDPPERRAARTVGAVGLSTLVGAAAIGWAWARRRQVR